MNATGIIQGAGRVVFKTSTDLEALGAYFEANCDSLRRFAYWLCCDWAQAEDLVQEAFIRAARADAKVREEGTLSYCRRTIVNLQRSGLRRLSVERKFLATKQRAPITEGPDVAERDAMWRLLTKLSTQQRACMVLRYYEDMTEPEIAAALGVTEGTVHKQISRGKDRLRQMIGEQA